VRKVSLGSVLSDRSDDSLTMEPDIEEEDVDTVDEMNEALYVT
jgi:hypothetical protein